MRGLRDVDSSTNQGEWFMYGKDAAGGTLELRIRRIPPMKEREIEFRHQGRKRAMRFGRGGREMIFDVDKALAEATEKACYALVDTRGFEVELGDAAAVDAYRALLPGAELRIDQLVSLDGRWTQELKQRVLDQLPELVTWIGTKSESLKLQAVEDEEGKD